MMGPVVCSYTGWCPGVLPTLAVMTGHHPVRPGSRGIDGVRGHETCQDLLAIHCLTQGQKSRIEVAEEPVEAVIDWQELILITEVVHAKLPRRIPQGLEQFRPRCRPRHSRRLLPPVYGLLYSERRSCVRQSVRAPAEGRLRQPY